MRKILFILAFIFTVEAGSSQDLMETLNQLKSSIQQVTVKDVDYEQKLDFKKTDGYLLTLNMSESKKGKSTQLNFNLFDLDEKKIKFDTRKNLAVVEIGTKGDKKVIQNIVDGKVGNFLNKVSIKAEGIEAARNLTDLFKTAVKSVEKEQHNFYEEKSDLVALLGYVENIMGKVSINEDTYEQSFTFQPENNTIVTFNSIHSNKNVSESYRLNFSDVNERKIDFTTKGNAVLVEFETNGKNNFVAYEKDGALTGFKNKVTLRASNIEEGRKIAAALANLKKLSDENQIAIFDEGGSLEDCLNFLSSNIKKINVKESSVDQSFTQSSPNQIAVNKIEGSKETKHEYIFNPSDLNVSKIQFATKSTNILLNIESKAKKSLIRYLENGQVENYKSKFDLHAENIEMARAIVNALKRLVKLSSENEQTALINGEQAPSVNTALDYLIKQIVDVKINENTFKQSLFYEEDKPEIITYEVVNTEKDEKRTYALNLKDINASKVEFATKGREVIVNAEIRGKQDLIQTTKNDEDDKYVDTLSIKANGIEEARTIVHTLKYLIGQVKG